MNVYEEWASRSHSRFERDFTPKSDSRSGLGPRRRVDRLLGSKGKKSESKRQEDDQKINKKKKNPQERNVA